MWNKVRITGTGTVANLGIGNIYGGIVVQVGGTTPQITVYDDTAVVTASLITPITNATTTAVAGAYIPPIGSSVSALTAVPSIDAGIVLERGLHVVLTSGANWTGWVLYR